MTHLKNRWQLVSLVMLTALGTLTLSIQPPTPLEGNGVQIGQRAIARSSGGRAGGGSFERAEPSSKENSPPRSNSPARSRSFNDPPPRYPRSNPGGGPVLIPPPILYPQPNYNPPYSSWSRGEAQGGGNLAAQGSGFGSVLPGLLMLLILGGISIAAIVWLLPKLTRRSAASPVQEIANNVFTVTKLQVALYAQAKEIQSQLSQLSVAVNTDEPEGLLRLLQESTLALLRQPEYWTHVSAHSKTASNALDAERLLNELSVEARSKLSVETLVNVGGRSQRNTLKLDPNEGPAAYIVVTLLVGTAHDHPLFDKIQTTAELQDALEKLAALPPEYLMTLELLWSPQDVNDSLTEEELLIEYSDLLAI